MLEVRPLEPAMLEGVGTLLRPFFGAAAAPEVLHHRFFENPDHPADGTGMIRGSVLLDDSQAVGFEGSIIRRGYFGQRPLTLCVHNLSYIRPAYSAYYADCAMLVLRQPGVDIHLANTANEKAQRIHRGLRWMPGAASNEAIACRLTSIAACAAAAMNRALPWPRGLCGRMARVALRGLDGLLQAGQGLPREASDTTPQRLTRIDDAPFGEFWLRLLAGNRGMLTARTPADLRWLFAQGLDSGRDLLVGRFTGMRLVGYVILRRCRVWHGTMDVGRIVDWVALDRDPDVLADLLRDACLAARDEGLALLEIMGFPLDVQETIRTVFRFRRAVKGNPCGYTARDRELQRCIQNDADGWFWGAVDGDRAN